MDADEFVAGFDYPMFVVTAVDPGTGARAGCLVGFATQTSIEPFRFLVCLSRRNRTYRVARAATVLAVHVLDRPEEVFLFERQEKRMPSALGVSGRPPTRA